MNYRTNPHTFMNLHPTVKQLHEGWYRQHQIPYTEAVGQTWSRVTREYRYGDIVIITMTPPTWIGDWTKVG